MDERSRVRVLPFTETDVDEMVRLYGTGLSTAEVAGRFGCLPGSVWARLRKRGVALRPVTSRRRRWFVTSHGYVRYGTQYLHRLVAEAWLERPLQPGEVVHHRNGNKTDNRPENLEVLPSNGEHHRLRHAARVWTDEMDGRMREMRATGFTSRAIAAALGVTKSAVDNHAKELDLPARSHRKAVYPQPRHKLRGEEANSSKLTVDAVLEIRDAHASGESQAAIARRHGVSRPCVGYIVRGQTWTHVP